ncbi:MAG TPA: hypothetical protein H9969_03525 [Candidatus Barnesiella merdipullorum]|nr:hypothetical protein [Candidatus Barnesiella merdipullorum]
MKHYRSIFLTRTGRWALLLWIGIATLFAGCCKDDPEPAAVNRTVLVYMLANNNLGSSYGFDSHNIDEMMQVAAAGKLNGGNLVIYRDGYDTNPQLIQIKRNLSGQAQQVVVKEYPDRNSASGEVMRSVIDETMQLFPAAEYGLILWSHSTGWVPGNSSLALSRRRLQGPPTRSFGQDGSYYMELDELADALPDHRFRFILTDVCFMGGVECAYQLRNKTDYYIGSVAEVMGAGMPYTLNIPLLFDYTLNLGNVCQSIYDYYNGMSGVYRTATTSLIDCSKLEVLADAVRPIFEAHSNEAAPDLSGVQHFDRQRPYIFFDLRDYLSQIATDDEMARLDQALAECVLYQAATPSILGSLPIYHHCGLSCYALGSGDATLDSYYTTLDWYQQVYPTNY